MTQSFSRADPFAVEQQQQQQQPADPAAAAFGGNPGTGAPETLVEMGEALLDLVNQAALELGMQLPPRQSVYMAPIPADCEQVAALFTGWDVTPIQDGGTTVCRPWRWMANFSLIITRCTPAMPGKNKPLSTVPAEKMTAAAKVASDDAEILLGVMNRLAEVGTSVTVVANPPQGGLQTTELNVPLISGGSFL